MKSKPELERGKPVSNGKLQVETKGGSFSIQKREPQIERAVHTERVEGRKSGG